MTPSETLLDIATRLEPSSPDWTHLQRISGFIDGLLEGLEGRAGFAKSAGATSSRAETLKAKADNAFERVKELESEHE